MWNRAKELIEVSGGSVRLNSRVVRIDLEGDRVAAVQVESEGRTAELPGDQFLSTLPLRELVRALNPQAPDMVREAAEGLKYRDFFTVGLIISN